MIIAFLLAILSLNAYAQPQPISHRYQNIIIFGDSLSDAGTDAKDAVGNNNWAKIPGKSTIGAPVTNVDQTSHLRPLWDNDLIKDLGPLLVNQQPLTPESQHIANPNTDNVSYAWASAQSGKNYVNDLDHFRFDDRCTHPGKVDAHNSCVPGAETQVQMYLSDISSQHLKPNPHTLFIIWIGGNDILQNALKLMHPFKHSPHKEAHQLSHTISNIVAAKNSLINAGVSPSQIYIMNFPDFTKFPVAKTVVHSQFLLDVVSVSLRVYDGELKMALTALTRSHYAIPSSHVIPINKLFRDMTNNPEEYGLKDAIHTCVNTNNIPYCRGDVFFNGPHPTTYADAQIAKFVAQKIKNANYTLS